MIPLFPDICTHTYRVKPPQLGHCYLWFGPSCARMESDIAGERPGRVGMTRMFTKCAVCHRWAECPYCGACHHCFPDVADVCAAYRAVKSAESDITVKVAHKRESTPYAPGMGQNGTKPKVTRGSRNWWEEVIWHESHPLPVHARREPVESDKPDDKDKRRRNALYGF